MRGEVLAPQRRARHAPLGLRRRRLEPEIRVLGRVGEPFRTLVHRDAFVRAGADQLESARRPVWSAAGHNPQPLRLLRGEHRLGTHVSGQKRCEVVRLAVAVHVHTRRHRTQAQLLLIRLGPAIETASHRHRCPAGGLNLAGDHPPTALGVERTRALCHLRLRAAQSHTHRFRHGLGTGDRHRCSGRSTGLHDLGPVHLHGQRREHRSHHGRGGRAGHGQGDRHVRRRVRTGRAHRADRDLASDGLLGRPAGARWLTGLDHLQRGRMRPGDLRPVHHPVGLNLDALGLVPGPAQHQAAGAPHAQPCQVHGPELLAVGHPQRVWAGCGRRQSPYDHVGPGPAGHPQFLNDEPVVPHAHVFGRQPRHEILSGDRQRRADRGTGHHQLRRRHASDLHAPTQHETARRLRARLGGDPRDLAAVPYHAKPNELAPQDRARRVQHQHAPVRHAASEHFRPHPRRQRWRHVLRDRQPASPLETVARDRAPVHQRTRALSGRRDQFRRCALLLDAVRFAVISLPYPGQLRRGASNARRAGTTHQHDPKHPCPSCPRSHVPSRSTAHPRTSPDSESIAGPAPV